MIVIVARFVRKTDSRFTSINLTRISDDDDDERMIPFLRIADYYLRARRSVREKHLIAAEQNNFLDTR